MSKQVYSSLPASHQKAIDEVGAEMEGFAMEAVQNDDERLARVFADAGLMARDMDEAAIDEWRTLAEATAWKDFSGRSAECAALLRLAHSVA
jgi:TRAP-type C4-dicarboxylate transport system substrate-binding protein